MAALNVRDHVLALCGYVIVTCLFASTSGIASTTRRDGLLDWIHRRKTEDFFSRIRTKPEKSSWDGYDFVIKVSNKDTFKVRRSPTPRFGTPWPLPRFYRPSESVFMIEDQKFDFRIVKYTCDVLESAISRYREMIFEQRRVSVGPTRAVEEFVQRSKQLIVLDQLDIAVGSHRPCGYPSLEDDESYTLHITEGGAFLLANETWGALRGLETFSQLVYQIEDNKLFINKTVIKDFPRFKHRGILVDTARHYIRKEYILKNLDAMTHNKMNVMHWHIVDDQSFPYKSHVYPNLTNMGAYDPQTHIYTHDDINEIIEYARLRGVRVIPEFDTPGHVRSWGYGHKEILTPCFDGTKPDGYFGPIHPISNTTFTFLNNLFTEVSGLFKDRYLHLGGDEVSTACWFSNPDILRFAKENGGNTKVMQHYIQRLIDTVSSAGSKRKQGIGHIVWQEVFDHGVQLNPDTIVQIWMGGSEHVQRVTAEGQRVIFSSCWYLDHIQYGIEWPKHYLCDPLNEGKLIDKRLMMGGEACMWSEYIDDVDFIPRLWPRAAAVAERLWSDKFVRSVNEAAPRLEEQRCRMIHRGFQVGIVNGPGHCKRIPSPVGRTGPASVSKTNVLRAVRCKEAEGLASLLNIAEQVAQQAKAADLDISRQSALDMYSTLIVLCLVIIFAVVVVSYKQGCVIIRTPVKMSILVLPPRRRGVLLMTLTVITLYVLWAAPVFQSSVQQPPITRS